MKIKLDECIPNAVSAILEAAGHDVHTVHQEGLSGSSDSVIWDVAQAEKRFLITTDLDFSDIRKHIPGTHQGILLFFMPFRKNPRGALQHRSMMWN